MALGTDLNRQTTPEELEELLEGLEKLLDRTRVLYEQYFMGIQKVAPMQLHRDVERRVRELTQRQIRNTALRFRFTTICQRFGAYHTYWQRTLRQIEQGKYVRDLVRVKRRADERGQDVPEEVLVELPRLVRDRIRRDRARLAERASPPPAGSARPVPPPGMDEEQCRELYRRYVVARELVGASRGDVSYEALVSSLGAQAAAIMTEHRARGVEFRVVVRDDKVVLRARPLEPDEPGEPDRRR